MDTQSERSKRFAHLLKPIKDLTQSWNIDIAAELEEYLADLESVAFSFDGGKTNLNFAEAALVIQGSACIYSRKVEFLYALVYQTLELVSVRKKKIKSRKPSSIDANGVDADVDFAADPLLLSLDGELTAASGIDLDEEAEAGKGGSSGATTLLARTPLSLLRMNTDGAAVGRDPAARMRAELAKFKMNSAKMHSSSGALMLDLDEALLFGGKEGFELGSIQPLAPSTTFVGAALTQELSHGSGPRALQSSKLEEVMRMALEQPAASQSSAATEATAGEGAWYGGGDDGGFDDDGDDDGGDYMNGAAVHEEYVSQHRRWRRRGSAVSLDTTVDAEDPWEPLDPHAASSGVVKPFRRGATVRKPVQAPTGMKALAVLATQTRFGGGAKKLPGKLFKTVANPEFADLFFAEQKARRKQWKAALGAAGYSGLDFMDDPLEEEAGFEEGAQLGREVEFDNYYADGDDGDDDDNTFDAAYEAPATGAPGTDEVGARGLINDETWAQVDEDIVPQVLHFGAGVRNEGAMGEGSYEAACREHIATYLAQAAQYASQTELSRRVQAWQDKVMPILRDDAARPAFDMRACGTQVLQLLEAPAAVAARQDNVVPFEAVVRTETVPSVCRLFLATLQLANTGNVIIHPGGLGLAGSADAPFGVELVSKTDFAARLDALAAAGE
ncbi:condensin-2 complex subunit H2 [Thecamonas trahens ATCC 50062]|uniref:Condensin-2 complex subunit H2 n=1 Tax=Thecamonas trahens ATCC 50062 TaxID=461836 RepID=A0A0L0DLP1_THETB|nr:condensin-2 complex subunit H2 [Thecamonas trahens ATCC 50062]KNC53229.1 condensin-2 complex subunit H2 [Thecamonas trahens ATCC 50062]|eukprot:XP_013754496.1 condensin-2 complex subunit H2 [Thecamonas trahens ATCC 50062]